MSFYSGCRFIFSPVLRLIFGIKREGKANMPSQGAVIVCSNHRSNYDPVILGASIRRDLNFMAKAELFKNPLFSLLITSLGAFPVRRGQGDLGAINKAVSILNSGSVLLMFPEGHRQKAGGEPKRFESGAARCAFKTHAVIVPAAIVTKGVVSPFKRNVVRIGKPLCYEELGFSDGGRENLRDVSLMLHDKVAELIRG